MGLMDMQVGNKYNKYRSDGKLLLIMICTVV